ncbi:hypothetical protein BDV95DRAFT_579388 [Massariosphaeria phaeospora]|uniref:Uncharacterized protein n=1 Tax=Massariosphaeria phaeospora TaxID=100035 RepID=A0A7C8MBA3_9PLEO|nr:hypothetical protein BDV95DRAFT_579388 [Massariosphaeria phaeospora]
MSQRGRLSGVDEASKQYRLRRHVAVQSPLELEAIWRPASSERVATSRALLASSLLTAECHVDPARCHRRFHDPPRCDPSIGSGQRSAMRPSEAVLLAARCVPDAPSPVSERRLRSLPPATPSTAEESSAAAGQCRAWAAANRRRGRLEEETWMPIKQHHTTKFTADAAPLSPQVPYRRHLRHQAWRCPDSGLAESLSASGQTLWAETRRPSYDVVCRGRCQVCIGSITCGSIKPSRRSSTGMRFGACSVTAGVDSMLKQWPDVVLRLLRLVQELH